jgi:hypothetical protein
MGENRRNYYNLKPQETQNKAKPSSDVILDDC